MALKTIDIHYIADSHGYYVVSFETGCTNSPYLSQIRMATFDTFRDEVIKQCHKAGFHKVNFFSPLSDNAPEKTYRLDRARICTPL
jgi:hypothetical protein